MIQISLVGLFQSSQAIEGAEKDKKRKEEKRKNM
jgi:hypothetical protein